MRIPRALWLSLTLIGAVGCHTTAVVTLADPTASVVRLEAPAGSGGRDPELRIQLRIGNPNSRELLLVGIRLDLEVDGEELARVVTNDAIFVRPEDGLILSLLGRPLMPDWQQRVRAIESLRSPYRLRGELVVAEPVRRVIPVERSGRLLAPPSPRPRHDGPHEASLSSISARPGPAGRSSRSARRE